MIDETLYAAEMAEVERYTASGIPRDPFHCLGNEWVSYDNAGATNVKGAVDTGYWRT